MSRGVVNVWNEEDGWGVITVEPQGVDVWAHFSVIEMTGYRTLSPGGIVEIEYERGQQDGYDYRATSVRLVTDID